MTNRKRAARDREEWRRLVAIYEAGDDGPGEFCRKHGLGSNRFYHWRRRFREETAGTGTDTDSTGPLIELPGLPVRPSSSPSRSPSCRDWRVELELGGGLVLRLR